MLDMLMESISNRIKDLRTIKKVQQSVLADYLGISRATYQNREKSGEFSWDEIALIADFFDESPFFIKYGLYDEELADIVHRVTSIKRSALEDFRFSIFDNLEEAYEKTGQVARFVALPSEDKDRIIDYVKSKNL